MTDAAAARAVTKRARAAKSAVKSSPGAQPASALTPVPHPPTVDRSGGQDAIPAAETIATRRVGIIDIGSNSVRLVTYAGPERAPAPVFNEKLMVGLGSSLSTTGAIEPRPFARSIAGLARFRALADAMELDELRCVATAAVRDASNGADFLAEARGLGLAVELLSGREEARAAGCGVLSAMPDADGIVADLGGGSLELVRVSGGETRHHSSFPLGVLRLEALRRSRGRGFGKAIRRMLADAGWPGEDGGRPLYLVGGSWRALARYEMAQARNPLPVVSGHHMAVEGVPVMARALAHTPPARLAKIPGISSPRVATLAHAAALLVPLVDQLQSSRLVVSTSGLREGLLYEALPPEVRAQDPLIVAAEAEGLRFSRFASQGRAIDQWIAPLFPDDSPAALRLRLAACLLSDVAYTANPDFRAERAAETALHGHWLGIDLADRMVMAQTVFAATGGQGHPFPVEPDADLLPRLDRAVQWGLAIRLAQRLSGGALSPLEHSRLERRAKSVRLHLDPAGAALTGEQVDKRLRQLADALGLKGVTIAG